jgi:uncharacterized protein YbjT (DUF2867 family)
VSETVVITGAFSYTGKYATRILLERGYRVRTLTSHPPSDRSCDRPSESTSGSPSESAQSNPFGDRVAVFPYNFDDGAELRRSLEGASALINTYWVRFPRGEKTFEMAVQNSRRLIQAAKDAGVRRIVHVSIANPSLDSTLGYYKGKALVEQAVRESGLGYSILRPTVIFGAEDILINNIAWFIRKFPVFAIPGDGSYGIRPIYVEHMARLLVDSVEQKRNTVTDAVGPETFTFDELVRLVARKLGRRVWLMHTPMASAYVATLVTGWAVGDVVLTWEEYEGLMRNLLASNGPSVGNTMLSQWLAENADRVGEHYASEVARHFRSQTHFSQKAREMGDPQGTGAHRR